MLMKARRKPDVGDDRKMAKIVVQIVIAMYCRYITIGIL
jgi:hypothetical protein